MQHLFRVCVNFFVGFAVVFATDGWAGATITDPRAGVLLPMALTLTAPLAAFSLQLGRKLLGLMQMGKLIQMFIFWLYPVLGLLIAAWLLPSFVTVSAAWLSGLVVLGVVTGLNELTAKDGIKRSWLPMRMPNRPRG